MKVILIPIYFNSTITSPQATTKYYIIFIVYQLGRYLTNVASNVIYTQRYKKKKTQIF